MYAELPLKSITESPTNPRKTWGDLTELTESIRTQGVLQPIRVRPKGKGYEVVFGHRRARAAAAAGLEQVPAVVAEMTDEQVLEAQLVENCQRDDIHPLEEAEGYRQLLAKRSGYDAARIAALVGKSVKYVYDRLKLLSLTKQAQALFREGNITAGHAILLARLKPADQERAIGEPGDGPLLFHEDLLWDPHEEDEKRRGDRAVQEETVKAISVRELQAWIDENVRFDVEVVEPMLFPETAQVIQEVREEAEKIVPITHDHHVTPEAKPEDGSRTYGPMSWRRADGQLKSKMCEHSVTGVIVVGPGRGEAFKVCIDKKKCAVHWGDEQRAAKKRATAAAKGGKTGEDRWEIMRRKQEEENRREREERDRWEKATPAILRALAEVVKKASAKASGQLGQLVVDGLADARLAGQAAALVPRGTSAEDLVRHAAFIVLSHEVGSWGAAKKFPKIAKAFGVDATKILDEVAPKENEPARPKEPKAAKKKPAKKKGGRK